MRFRLALGLLAFAAGAGILALKWAELPAGRIWLADRGSAPALHWVRDRLGEAVRAGLSRAGIDADSVRVQRHPGDGPVTFAVTTQADLLLLNAEVTASVEDVGGRMHRGYLRRVGDAAVLDLTLGTERHLTHRLLVRRGAEARAIPAPPLPRGRLAIVIDDWGHSLGSAAHRILALPAPVTLAVLPERPRSLRVLTEARRAGKRTLLHYPMEPEANDGPGPGELALRVGMDAAAIRALTLRFLDALPGVMGVSNHMGSRATRHRREMEAVMGVLAERGLFFLDSLTTPHSVAYAVAREMGVPALRNDLFLDLDTPDPRVVEERLLRLVEMARRRGWAIGIGHVTSVTAEALERVLPPLLDSDVRPVFLDELLPGPPG